MRLIRTRTHQINEVCLSLVTSFDNRLVDIPWKLRLHDDVVVQVILQVFSTFRSTMSIIDTKDLKFRPLVGRHSWHLISWLNHIQNDRNPVLVSFTHDAYICVCGKCFDCAESFGAHL
jgi:hypothetical protein